MMMIHNPWTVAQGEAKDMQKVIEMLGEIKESIINAYELRTGLSRTKLSHLMDSESWFNAKKAVELGFADKILFDKQEEHGMETESYSFSRNAAQQDLLEVQQPKKTIPLNQLEKRLNLLK